MYVRLPCLQIHTKLHTYKFRKQPQTTILQISSYRICSKELPLPETQRVLGGTRMGFSQLKSDTLFCSAQSGRGHFMIFHQ